MWSALILASADAPSGIGARAPVILELASFVSPFAKAKIPRKANLVFEFL